MPATVVSSVSVSGPFAMSSKLSANPPLPSSSRSKQPSASSNITSPSPIPEAASRPLGNRIRSTLEQTLRSAGRTKKPSVRPVADEFSTVKGKEKAVEPKEKEKTGMLRRLESKVNFRRSVTPSPIPPSPAPAVEKPRVAGFTSFVTPSLRQASISSPALHLSSQAIPSPKSRPVVTASSSSTSDALVSPTRDKTRRSSTQSPPLRSSSKEPVSKHRATRSQPLNIPSSSSTADLGLTSLSPPETPTGRRSRDIPSPPVTPTPQSRSRPQLAHISPRNRSVTQISLGSPPASPSPSPSQLTPRGTSPIRPRSPSSSRTRVVSPSHRGLTSASASHLPISPSGHAPKRPSIDSPRRPSIDSPRRVSGGLSPREESPSPIRPRPTTPSQRSYAQNRHYNISTTSFSSPSNPEHRELIRTATSMLCKEIIKPPVHMSRSEAALRDWEEVEVRTQALIRHERVWSKSGFSGSSSNIVTGGLSSSGLSASGEERERRLFCEALRDGLVLCQLMNKLRSSSIVKPDPREDGFVRTANVTRFLASCASYGLPNEDLFQRDDLIEGTGESLARVAKTIIALIKFVDAPVVERSKHVSGQNKKPVETTADSGHPYGQGGSSRTGSTSSPNLLQHRATSPAPASPASEAPDETGFIAGGQIPNTKCSDPSGNIDRAAKEIQKISPPPKSPLRSRPSQAEDGNGLFTWALKSSSPPRVAASDSTSPSVSDAAKDPSVRQSMASTTTNSSATTMFSSLLDAGRSSSAAFSKFGTIRTITTDATSEAPSISRTEGSSIAEELSRKRSMYNDASAVDLSRVVEEAEEIGSSRGHPRDKAKAQSSPPPPPEKPDKVPAIRLGKGIWPDDFMDALQTHNKTRGKAPDSDEPPLSPSQISAPRKLAIVGGQPRRNETIEPLHQFPRRPSHRARHSVDTPTLIPKDPGLRRDSSPDGLPSSRVMLRRHSTKPAPRNGVYLPRGNLDDPRGSDSDVAVPFPRTPSAEHVPPSPREDHHPSELERPRIRGRFQSDIETSKRRPRPSSYDELGAKPTRSRFESMVNLGAASSSNASASDLINKDRDSLDGSVVRKTLIIKEEGKPPTHFQLGNCIGRGQFGSVYRALNLNTGQMVAVKRIRLEGLKEEEVTTLMREVDLVKSLSHPSIVKYEGMARDVDTLSIVLEYAENGSLGQTLKAFGKLNERLVASYVVKILEGLHYLHRSDVVHCDLKAANILTTKNGNVKLSDFGVSLNMRAVERDIKDVAGTPNWMAPEVIELKGASPKSDIWSLALMFRIVEDDMPPIPEGCSEPLRDFLSQCFDKDPAKRPTAELLCEHPWLKKNWGAHKLRPQDSIPFLRRVSADLHKSDVTRYLPQFELAETPTTEEFVSGSPPNRRLSSEHSFVKTTFSKPMVCRVCLLNVKKSAVLCAQCSLIAHSKCASSAPPTCDLRAQLLLYAQYAQQGNPGSAYSNPMDLLDDNNHPKSPMSDVSYVAHSPRTSMDTPGPPSSPPPTAYKFMAAFKRSRSPEPGQPAPSGMSTTSTSSLPHETKTHEKPHEKAKLQRKNRPRPPSLASNSTNADSSVRSTATGAEILTAVHETETPRSPKLAPIDDENRSVHWHIPGELPADSRAHKKSKSSGNCIVQ
ncbi:STE/STE11/cdc15 protein kinase [Mycena floridula]|nr:STE/STE11/cdc15 protein kinase [Mycena floridula]